MMFGYGHKKLDERAQMISQKNVQMQEGRYPDLLAFEWVP